MGSLLHGLPLIYANAPPQSMQKRRRTPPRFTCRVVSEATSAEPVVVRRSGNYKPSLWDLNYIFSLDNKYSKDGKVQERAKLLKKDVRKMVCETEDPFEQLELIDTLQRLGVAYHFESEIMNILTKIYDGRRINDGKNQKIEDLHAIALEFRLLRQHGFGVSEDIFDSIKIEDGDEAFVKGLDGDTKGLLSLYEASYLSTKSDTKLKEIRSYAMKRLRDFDIKSNKSDGKESQIREMVIRSLEMPYHWRTRRLEARWYIDAYERRHDMNPLLLEFAKLDFNILQAFHQEELKDSFSWWSKTGLKQLDFARDRILENYLWSVELFHGPQFGYLRRVETKINALVTTIDDIYDVYGTLEELERFTEAVQKWDVNLVEELPEYMRLCFLVLFNEVNQMGHDILRDKKFNAIPYLKKSWAGLMNAYMIEAKWHKNGYKPSFKEYIENASISISAPVILIYSYCMMSDQISKETLDGLADQPIVRSSGIVFRVANDFGTSPDELARGDVLKSLQCYMHETGVSETEAREHMIRVISDAYDEMNYEKTARSSSLYRRFMDAGMDLGRMAQCMYLYGDGHGFPDKAKTVDRTQSLLFNPVPLH